MQITAEQLIKATELNTGCREKRMHLAEAKELFRDFLSCAHGETHKTPLINLGSIHFDGSRLSLTFSGRGTDRYELLFKL